MTEAHGTSHPRLHLAHHRQLCTITMPRSVPSAAQKPWHHSITLDRVMEIGQRPIFFFWTTLIVVFYTQPSHSILVQCIVWLAVVTLLHALSWANRRVAWGAARKVDWADEVVVVTGGSSGLGRVIAETYGMRGASVAVLDVRPFHTAGEGENGESVRWYDCDVGDVNAVARVKDLIEKDVCSFLDLNTILSSPALPPLPCHGRPEAHRQAC